ncbi:hypothetical protein KBI23_15895 [bacterium]|nr:hypothetical protein [bacterium]MBP9807414.1 hypothetical protein [bacterium]
MPSNRLIKEIGVGLNPLDPLGECAQLGVRFCALLRYEYQYRLASYDFIDIGISDLPIGEFQLIGIVPIVSKRVFNVAIGVAVPQVGTLAQEYWTNIIARVLFELAQKECAELEPIESSRIRLLEKKNETPIYWTAKVTRTSRYLIEPELQITGFGCQSTLLYVTITDLKTQEKARRLILQAALSEVEALVGRFAFKNESLVVHPQRGAYTEGYRSRGFSVPTIIPLSKFFEKLA